jgi:cysteine desulfurase
VVHVTRNFTAESPLAPKAREVLLDAFDQGWHDPLKLSQSASQARTLRNEAVESISHSLGCRPSELEFLGEPALGHFLAIQGLISPSSTLVHSSVDRKEILALARGTLSAMEIPVNFSGHLRADLLSTAPAESVLALQGANGETGVVQDLKAIIDEFDGQGSIALDLTAAGAHLPLPSRWDCALYDSRAWYGPQGLAVLAIKDGSPWRNPLPHVSSIRTPQTFSLPLLIASAVALEDWVLRHAIAEPKMRSLSHHLRTKIGAVINDFDIAGDLATSLPNINSISFLYVEGEELLRDLERSGFLVDSGSACTAEDLQPSHVLAAMGLLTHGNIRVTIHPETISADIDEFVKALSSAVARQRAS